jgi:pimeloyl-ACP methyl ester carboxylesterase
MRILFSILLLLAVLLQSCATALAPATIPMEKTNKKYDLVLVHGLANMHKWSESFLETCLQIWGSGRVFVIYTAAEASVVEKDMNGGILIVGGGDGGKAGIDPIDEQVANVTEVLQTLQDGYGLRAPFSIMAHSMGGLVARQYIYKNPGTVASLVTLGTPHHGSPLADSFQWTGFFLNATDAVEDLKPRNVARFNEEYPAEGTPLAFNNKMYMIRGVPDGTDCFGWAGELLLGWQILSIVHDTGSDGLVPYHSAVINGAEHIADFPHYDHYDLVRQPDVVKTAAEYLP